MLLIYFQMKFAIVVVVAMAAVACAENRVNIYGSVGETCTREPMIHGHCSHGNSVKRTFLSLFIINDDPPTS